jgi:hypothetical protein
MTKKIFKEFLPASLAKNEQMWFKFRALPEI